MNPQKQKRPLFDYAKYSSMALQMLVIIAGGIFCGFKLDEYLKFKLPLFTVLFSMLSVGFAVWYVTKDLLKK
jgi:intracellular septation protein A